MGTTAWLWQSDIDDEKRTPHVLVKMKGRISHRGFRTKNAEKELRSLGIKEGSTVLDFCCGAGTYTLAAARIVGEKGLVHAVDLHPSTLEMIEERSRKLGLGNVETIYSDMETGVDEESVDVVIFYDVLKGTMQIRVLINEVHRVVKKEGVLLVRQSGMKEDRIKEILLKDGHFTYMGKHGKTLRFRKIEGAFHEIS